MSLYRAWFFRILIASTIALMIVGWFMDWWACQIYEIGIMDVVVIHPWGLWMNEDEIGLFMSRISGADMPGWFAYVMWAYLAICIVLLLYSMFIKEKTINLFKKIHINLPSLIMIGIGISYIIVVLIALIFAAVRTGDFFDMHLIGFTLVDAGEPLISGAEADLKLGYWLSCAVGPILIILALLRNKIIGNK
ncbi:MAG: hypothetical protein ACOWWR_14065 [Eubacteriales bacterium]